MKKRLFSLIFSIIAIAVSAQNVGIIPQPQRVVVNEEHLKIEKKTKSKVQYQIIESIGVNGDNQDQAYTLEVNKNGIIVNATTEKGLFYGKQSVEQLFSHYENRGQIPCMNVVDWPDMKYRGWMDDISRGPIPTLQFLKKEK